MLHVITVITDADHKGFREFLKTSAAVNGLKLSVITTSLKEGMGYREKDYQLKRFLEDIDDEELILYTDGYDAVFFADAGEVADKYEKQKTKILFSAETHCWPDPQLKTRYPSTDGIYKYLNSGGFIGRASAIKSVLNSGPIFDDSQYAWSNQYFWTLKYFDQPENIGIDYGCDIFCTMSPEIPDIGSQDPMAYYTEKKQWFEANFETVNGRIFNKTTNSWPSHVHFNGKSKCLMDDSLLELIKKPGKQKS